MQSQMFATRSRSIPWSSSSRPHDVGAAHLEPLVAVGGGGEADIVQHRAEVEHLVVELDAVGGGERRRELVAALAVGRDDRRALAEQPLHLGRERRDRWIDEIPAHAVTAYEGNAAGAALPRVSQPAQLREPRTLDGGGAETFSTRCVATTLISGALVQGEKIVPGLRIRFGSNATLIRRMRSTFTGSSSSPARMRSAGRTPSNCR